MKNIVGSAKKTVLAMAAALLAGAGAANADDAVVCRDNAIKDQWRQAVPACTAAAERGNVYAQTMLGLMYKDGLGVAQDYNEAARWLTQTANQGDDYAQFSLGTLYSNGQGVVQDYAQAVKWYTLAAAQGQGKAQHNLGVMYGRGRGVAQDYIRAHMWFNLAAVSGDADSVKGRDVTASMMTREQIAKAQRMAVDCKAKNYKAC